MISVGDALRHVLAATPVLGTERVLLGDALGRVAADDVVSTRAVPAAANSAMDGFAVRAADVAAAGARLRVVGSAPAGSLLGGAVPPGAAAKIFTGSVIPDGTDTVVKVEDTSSADGVVTIAVAATPGQNVRLAGEDVAVGAVVLAAGTRIGPADLGVLASVGRATVTVHRRPRVAIVATGAELVEVDEEPGLGQVVNSNAYALVGAVREAGGEAVVLPIVRDRFDDIRDRLDEAARADVVLSTGGVSVGEYDFVKEALDALGVERRFWKVAQKPGKPLTFGTRGACLWFGLPGNPVSALVCFAVYVRPALRRLAGHRLLHLPCVEATLVADQRKAKALTEFVRVRLTQSGEGFEAAPMASQSSGVLSGMAAGAGLLVGPAAEDRLVGGRRYGVLVTAPDGLSRAAAGGRLARDFD
ncbi:MAG: molybdopterin molybdotransferase MoeA [bacterium]|nr:molybdopterin molybdotransferase MoeA [bacterium]